MTLPRLHVPSAAVALLATAITAAVVALPSLRFAYEAPSLRVALETSAALIALVVAYLMWGRFLRSRRLDALLLAFGLALLAASNLALALLIATSPVSFGRLVCSAVGVAGAAILAATALAPTRKLRRAGRAFRGAAFVALGITVLAVFLLATAVHYFPPNTDLLAGDSGRPQIASQRGLLGLQIVLLTAFAIAAAGFAHRAAREGDRFLGFMAAGATLAAFARLHYVLFPPLHVEWVYTGDVLRLLFYLVLLVGGALEIEEYWRSVASTAVHEERRRIARELHDGVAQELAFIGRRARRLASRGGADEARQIAASADRALADSRRAIAALTQPLDRPLAAVLAEAVQEVASRHPVELDLALAGDVRVGGDVREALVRIACEAVSNAARHGEATTVRVVLEQGDGVRFRVVDDGIGFDPATVRPGRFGLVSMRERAQALGGSFSLRSTPGSGTEVEVELP